MDARSKLMQPGTLIRQQSYSRAGPSSEGPNSSAEQPMQEPSTVDDVAFHGGGVEQQNKGNPDGAGATISRDDSFAAPPPANPNSSHLLNSSYNLHTKNLADMSHVSGTGTKKRHTDERSDDGFVATDFGREGTKRQRVIPERADGLGRKTSEEVMSEVRAGTYRGPSPNRGFPPGFPADASVDMSRGSFQHGGSASSSYGAKKFQPPPRGGTPRVGLQQGGGASSSSYQAGGSQIPARPPSPGIYQHGMSPGAGKGPGMPPRTGTPRSAMPGKSGTPGAGNASGRPLSRHQQQRVEQQQKDRELANLKQEKEALEDEMQGLRAQFDASKRGVATLAEEERQLIDVRTQYEADAEKYKKDLAEARPTWEAKIAEAKQRKEEVEAELNKWREKLRHAKDRFAVLSKTKELELAEIEKETRRKQETEAEFKDVNAAEMAKYAEIEEWKKKIEEARTYAAKVSQKRSLLVLRTKERFNEYIEVKGNIRVFVRIRPLAEGGNEGKPANIRVDERSGIVQLTSESFLNVSGCTEQTNTWQFHFDRVFNTDSTQKEVFEEISQLVKSALDGYKVAILAYGQTGGGKTYTMEGPPMKQLNASTFEHKAGVLPRAAHHIFQHIKNTSGWKFECSISYVEIYNENVRDLLNGGKDVDVQIGGQEAVLNCSVVRVASENEVFTVLERAQPHRSFGKTSINERSSRAHSVFQLKIEGRGPRNHTLKGMLSLVDLAGSERVEKSKATGDRMREAQHINKSLSALADVITALADKSAHVPYRNSKLTQMLKDSLGGDAKTLMFANIPPTDKCLSESINSLRFATKVNSVSKFKKRGK